MLVSAAIDPYRKSCGNSRNSAAMPAGSSASECITASPRNTCVPGVHACATPGVSATATRATSTNAVAFHTHRRRDGRAAIRCLDPKTLSLAAYRALEIVQLGLDDVVDRVARPAEIVGDVLADLPAGNRVPRILAASGRPARPAKPEPGGVMSRPAGSLANALEHGGDGTTAGGSAAENEGESRADRHADECRRQEIVL